MKRSIFLIGAVFAVLWAHQPVEALRYPPGLSGGGYVAVNLLGPTEVQSGDNFTYTIILTNDSSNYAQSVQVTYLVPDGLRWRDRFSHAICRQNLNEIICIEDLVAPGSHSIPLNFTTDRLIYTNSTFCPRTIQSFARISAGSSDTFSGDNVSPTLSTRITCYDPPTRYYRQGIDLQITLTAPRSIPVGEILTTSAVVTNAGTENAMFVTVLLSIPSGLSIQDLPRFCQITGSMITCTNFTLRSGESRVLTFQTPLPSSLSCPTSVEWRAQTFSGSQNSYSIYRTATARTSVPCLPAPVSQPSHSSNPLIPSNNTQGNVTGGTSGRNTSGRNTSGGLGQWVWHGPYRDILGVCDLPLDVVLPCPTEGYSSGGGRGGSTGGTGGSFGGGIGGETSRDGASGGGTSRNKGSKKGDDLPQKKSTNAVSTTITAWPRILPPDNSGNWVWNENTWVYVGHESTVVTMDTDQWTLQYCTGQERGTITYEIQVTNQFETSIANADVVEMLNPTAVCIKEAHAGLIAPRHILWNIDLLNPHTTQTIRYTVGILSHVPDQFVIANLTHAGTMGPHILTRDFEMVEISRKSH